MARLTMVVLGVKDASSDSDSDSEIVVVLPSHTISKEHAAHRNSVLSVQRDTQRHTTNERSKK